MTSEFNVAGSRKKSRSCALPARCMHGNKSSMAGLQRCKRCSEPASLDAVKYTRLSFRQANDETLIHTYRPNLKSKGTVEAFGPREKGYEVVSRRLCLLMHNSKKGIRGFMRY